MIIFGIVSEVQTKITIRAGEEGQTIERWVYIKLNEKAPLPLYQFWIIDDEQEFSAGSEVCLRLHRK